MSVVDTSMPNYFAGATTILTNAQEQADIAAAFDAFGYDAAALQEGQTLLDTARSLYDT